MIQTISITDRASWLAGRMQDVTASDIGSICGVDPYRSPLRVFAEKTGAIQPDDESNIMRRGRWMEYAAMAALAEMRPSWDFRKASVYLRDTDLRIGATPDAAAIDPDREGFGTIQIKVVALRKFNADWRGQDEDEDHGYGDIRVPLYYQLQTITEAKMMGAQWAALAALVVGEFMADLHILDVEIHDAAWERIKSEVAFFWRCVAEGRQPPVDPARDASTLYALFPRETRTAPIDLSGSNDLPGLLAERAILMDSIKAAEARKSEIETIAKDRLREDGYGALPGWGLSWLEQKRSGHVVAPFQFRKLTITKRRVA